MKKNQCIEELEKNYSFNTRDLKNFYINSFKSTFTKLITIQEVQSLLQFRIKHFKEFRNCILFRVESKCVRNFSDMMGMLYRYERNNTSLSDKLNNVLPNCNWAMDYFVNCSFPSLFGHFCSEEFIRYGYTFILENLDDKLVVELVKVFLEKAYAFRMKLHENLIIFISNNDNKNSSPVKDIILLNAIKRSLSYLTIYHFNIIKELNNKDKNKASCAVKGFLQSVMESLKYSTILAEYAEPYGMLLNDNDFFGEILNTFLESPKSYSVLPNIHDFINCEFPIQLTKIDLAFLEKFANNHNQEREVSLTDAFIINSNLNFSFKFDRTINVPKTTSFSSVLSEFIDNKSEHDFLVERANNYAPFISEIEASKEVLNLIIKNYSKIMDENGYDFIHNQIVFYCIETLNLMLSGRRFENIIRENDIPSLINTVKGFISKEKFPDETNIFEILKSTPSNIFTNWINQNVYPHATFNFNNLLENYGLKLFSKILEKIEFYKSGVEFNVIIEEITIENQITKEQAKTNYTSINSISFDRIRQFVSLTEMILSHHFDRRKNIDREILEILLAVEKNLEINLESEIVKQACKTENINPINLIYNNHYKYTFFFLKEILNVIPNTNFGNITWNEVNILNNYSKKLCQKLDELKKWLDEFLKMIN